MECKIEGDEIVVRVKIDALPNAWDQHVRDISDPEAPEFKPPKIEDAEAFAPHFLAELNHADEIGNTPLMRVFDEAMEMAINNGADGVVP